MQLSLEQEREGSPLPPLGPGVGGVAVEPGTYTEEDPVGGLKEKWVKYQMSYVRISCSG